MPEDADFFVPDGVYEHFADGHRHARPAGPRRPGRPRSRRYRAAYPELADELERMQRRELPDGWEDGLPTFPPDAKGLATRDSSGQVLNALAEERAVADRRLGRPLALDQDPPDVRRGRRLPARRPRRAATCTSASASTPSAAIANGMALTKLRPYWSAFLIFSDYARGAIRLSALMEIPVLHIFTHDSIGVGEDGPTHQPVEQLASLRAMPGLLVFRPADANEVVETWRVVAALRHEPAALVLSRQALPTLDRSRTRRRVGRGARAPTCWPRRAAARRTCSCWPPAPRCTWRWRPATSSRRRASAPAW